MLQFKSFHRLFTSPGNDDDNDSRYPRCAIPSVDILQIDDSPVKRDRALTHLLRLNHLAHSMLYKGYKGFPFHNHIVHLLGTAYLFGADEKQLHDLYEREDKDIDPWKDSPGEVTGGDWRRYLGDENYQRAFLDFFEDELVREGYDWKKVLMGYMLVGESPLLNSLICGFAHPLIHFGYAIELNSREAAMEALTLTAASHDFLHTYVSMEIPPPTNNSTSDPLAILARIREDPRFDGVCDKPGAHNQTALFKIRENVILEYYNQLDLVEKGLESILQSLATTTVLMLTTTHKPYDPQFDFFLCHALTALYAVRTILPIIPAKHHTRLIRSQWLWIIYVYLTQMRPSLKPELISSGKVDITRGWEHVNNRALERGLMLEVHYIKALRSMREFSKLYQEDEQFYLLAATKFAVEFQEWVGFEYAKDTLDIKS
ncbi:MGS207 protein [Tirmania nivea]|nr:MGS207 protein [Tirmania nivea]